MSQIHLVAEGTALAVLDAPSHLPHVLFVVDGFPKTLGGGERIVLRLAALLPQYGYRASILTLALHPESEFQAARAPCPVYLLPLTNTYGPAALRGAFALRRFLRKENVRIVQTFFESSDIWAGFVTRVFSRAKLVWSRRDMGILRTPKHTVAYRAMRHFPHAVVAVSARVAAHIHTVDRVPAAKVHVVYNGLDLLPQTSSGRRLRTATPVVTTIGNVRQVKGHDLLVEAASQVVQQYPACQFTVAGAVLEENFYEALQKRVEALGLTANFTFVGKIIDLHEHLAQATLFVLPSRSEGFSNALIEAMAVGVPSIATDVGGNAEAIQNGQSGLIVPPNDAGALAGAILRVLGDGDLAKSLSRGGRDAVEQRFSSDAMMRNTVKIFNDLLRR